MLVKGVTFKEDVSDIRNSKIIDTVKEMLAFNINVDIEEEYGVKLSHNVQNGYDAVIVTVPHKPYLQHDDNYFKSLTHENGLVVDLKGLYKGKIKNRKYWSL